MQEENVVLPNYKIPPHLQKYFRPKLCSCYICNMIKIFREVRRVLRKDGTLWLNMGDSYAGYWGNNYAHKPFGEDRTPDLSTPCNKQSPDFKTCGFKPKDLLGIPWRLALALQADGWWLRSDIIWHKPNPMPESVTDRPTKAHEYVFLLTKSAKYFYDAEAVKEKSLHNHSPKTRNSRPNIDVHGGNQGTGEPIPNPAGGRNKRTVWTIPTKPFPQAHFATFPEKLIEPCILAGTSEKGCCAECGSPWERVIDYKANYEKREIAHQPNNTLTKVDSTGWKPPTIKTTGWQPGCQCYGTETLPKYPKIDKDENESYQELFNLQRIEPVRYRRQTLLGLWELLPTIPCTVLDIFGGAMTTAIVAHKLNCKFIMIELSKKYIDDIGIPRIEKELQQKKLPCF